MKIIAHRGDTRHHPENTLSAFHAAHAAKADGIELDVHLTTDGDVVVHHDYLLGDPDDGSGYIFEQTSATIRKAHINNSEHIPTLLEVFEALGDTINYEIELKGFGPHFIEHVVALVQKHKLTAKVEFTSPHPYALTHVKKIDPTLKTGMFVPPPPSWMERRLAQAVTIQNALLGNIDVIHCPIELIDREFAQKAHEAGLLVHAADCDTKGTIAKAYEFGVDQLSTNNLAAALAFDNRGNSLSKNL